MFVFMTWAGLELSVKMCINIESLRSDWHRYFVILAAEQGYKVKEVPVRFYPRKSGNLNLV